MGTDLPIEERRHLSVQEAAYQFLNVSESTVRRLLGSGAFPRAFKVGKLVRIPMDDLMNYHERQLISRRQK